MRDGLNRRGLFRLAAPLPLTLAATGAAWADTPTATGEKILHFAPREMPASLDPIATPSFATRTAAMAVFETLYGTDAALNPVPQMVERHRIEEDGQLWFFELRPNLWFHDGAKVTARDCIASLRRWMRGDRAGRALGQRMDLLEAVGDLTIRLRLTRPDISLPLLLTKSELSPPVIMPERICATAPDTPVEQIIGSGPFRVANFRWRSGDDLDFVRFEQYQPRTDASSFTGGRRVALLDRVSWRFRNDPVAALRDGSADWAESLPPDFAADQLRDAHVSVDTLDRVGNYAMLRCNTLRGPTANQKIRQTILAGVDPGNVMEAVFQRSGERFAAPIGLYPSASEYANAAGMDRIGGKQSPKMVKSMLKAAGYNGETMVLINPVDNMIHSRLTAAVLTELREIGLTIEQRDLDSQAFAAWRARARTDDWSLLCDSVPAADHHDPVAISAGPGPSDAGLAGGGTAGGGTAGGRWPGWTDDAATTRTRDNWIDARDLRAKRSIAAQLQDQVFTFAPFVPLGVWFPLAGWRDVLTGLQKGPFPVFWEVARKR
jgi:peptide/nickel transport system substrate-binding protein